MNVTEVVAQVAPVLIFLLAITVVAEIAETAGVFDAAGALAARLGRGRVVLMWLWVVAAACLATITLSLDTTAVLVTPVVLAMAKRLGIAPLPFAMTTVWLANTASLLLPVSNLTNLLAVYHLSGGVRAYLALSWRPALVAMAVTVLVLWLLHRRELRGRYESPARTAPGDPVLFRIAAGVCLALGPVFALGVPPAVAAVIAAAILLAALAIRAPDRLRSIEVPWRMVLILAAVFAAVQVALAAGLETVLRGVAGAGTEPGELLRLAGVGALTANAVNNLPAYLALEPAAAAEPLRLMALLIGVGVAPVVTLWASLATLLWRQRCDRAGVHVSARRFAAEGLVLAVPATVIAVLVL
ncbi:Arsenical pump membrane protein OS=Tsukamurella paurometabola (strain ATCC 8368 / DSM / CCUG 35730 / CIP 100753 / JCM 10117 / KCTC 9821 / NBRC 16120 / NCIMB 702349 / NCTC 13040) OX=521096 GN=Tpau_2549 PE=3 SV=1 [Tsukamurella paurometabola]|uniref:Arsenical pump membrane protein n=1 Tax=Tsukamurella paurometabola (strain ATCC 8368 / DSM 20162 / CCUG 35730 / CIP 100753 / JCM 10117 / KCTC 9821 / NBRC 16120 / NCIMB 702349 / NCTC 13040) TaxID=521096 RepID=D5URU7_TSUPD|nr:SLC13 family permease [Tsukamurella paurometabola]ADG79152.1 Arsenical pump membrane protein [Tsukamurella paurometabola DSM 20162]SUP34299.1 Arsenic efflux pump protein [Tsukamurella paurometabola]